MKTLFKTEQPFDFTLVEEQGTKAPLVLEPSMFSFSSGTQKTLLKDRAMISMNSERRDLVPQLTDHEMKLVYSAVLVSALRTKTKVDKPKCCSFMR